MCGEGAAESCTGPGASPDAKRQQVLSDSVGSLEAD